MLKYTNKQLTAAEIIARLIEMAQEVRAEADRGTQFSPPLGTDELSVYDVIAQNPSAAGRDGRRHSRSDRPGAGDDHAA
ncbi:hypothetical protein AU506_16700 [Lonsdalea populi]|nr:hypothetical protein AU506_16700 [Lonsdalea populi]